MTYPMKGRVRLTDTAVRALKLADGVVDKTWFDVEVRGYGVRARKGGRKVFIVQYDFHGKTEKVTIGSTEIWKEAKARKAAKDVLAAVRLGRNPAAEKRAAKAEAAETFSALLPRHLAHQRARLRPRSYKEVERHLLGHCAPLHHLPLAGIDQRRVAILLGKIAEKSGPRACNVVRASGSGFFTWAAREGLASANPFANTNKAAQNGPRDRTPSAEELRQIWQACPDGDYGTIVRLLMLTGARKTEIGDLRWSEIDFDQALIALPAGRTKGRRSHEIPLSAPALAILKAQPRVEGRDFVFGRGAGGFSGWSKAKLDLDDRIEAARNIATPKGKPYTSMQLWVVHDLRRSISTLMHDRLGIAPHIVEDILGHATFRQGVAGVYNRSSYRAEKRRALDLWGEHLMAAAEGRDGKIVPLRGA